MPEPTSSYTLGDLILRVAKAAGIAYYGSNGQGRARVPVDEITFHQCLDIVNDGIKMFTASAPETGWRWMNQIMTVVLDPTGEGTQNVSSDPARYLLDENFLGEVTGPIRYAKDSNRGHGIEWASEGEIRFLREVQVQTGYPTKAAVRPYGNRRWELIVDPAPTAADSIEFPYRVGFNALLAEIGTASGGSDTTLVNSSLAGLYPDDYFNAWTITIIDGTGERSNAVVTDYTGSAGTFSVADWLTVGGQAGGTNPAAGSVYFVSDGNKHPAGMQFDEAILAACLAKAELEIDDLKLGYMDKFLELDLKKAYEIDARSAPRKLGRMLPGTRTDGHGRIWNTVTKT